MQEEREVRQMQPRSPPPLPLGYINQSQAILSLLVAQLSLNVVIRSVTETVGSTGFTAITDMQQNK